MKKKSHSDLMKSGAKHSKKKGSNMLDIYIDMLLVEARLKCEKEKLTEEIDRAIDNRDKKAFLKLAKQMADLNKRFGT